MASDEELQWELKIRDLMSGEIGAIKAQLDELDKTLGKLGKNDIDKALGKQAKSAEDQIAKALGSAKSKLTGARGDFGKAWGALLETPLGKRAGGAFDALGGRASKAVDGYLRPLGQRMSAGANRLWAPFGRALEAGMESHFRPFGQRMGEAWGRFGGLFDRAGGRLSSFGRSAMGVLGPLGAGFGKVGSAVSELSTALGSKLGPALGRIGGIAKQGAMMLAGVAVAMTAAAAALTVSAGKWALGELALKETSLESLASVTGNRQTAKDVFQGSLRFAGQGPFDVKTTMGAAQSLLGAGFKEDELWQVMRAVGDVGAQAGNDPAKVQAMLGSLGKIQALGKLDSRAMMGLNEAGVSRQALLEEIAGRRGTSTAGAESLIASGRIDAAEGVSAIMETIRKTISGGRIGGLMERQADTLPGLWSRTKQLPERLLLGTEMSGATNPIKRMLRSVLEALEEGRPLFLRTQRAFENIGEAWGRVFGGLEDSNAEAILGRLLDGIETFGTKAAPFAEGFFPELGRQMGQLFDVFTMGDVDDLRENGESVARALGIVASAVAGLGKAAMLFIDAIDSASDWLVPLIRPLVDPDGAAEDVIEQMRIRKATERGELYTPNSNGPVDNSVTTSVGQIVVQVQPGDEDAGIEVANQVQGQMPQQLTNFATEMGG